MSPEAAFREQAAACEALGSPFTARLLHLLAANMAADLPCFQRIRDWPGDITHRAQSVPLRLVAGLHALVLTGRDPALASLYPPAPAPDDSDLTTTVLTALDQHADLIDDWLNQAPQTNEVGRSAVLIPAGHMIAKRFGLPLRLLELGASAGLNLYWDQMAVDTAAGRLGASDAAVTLTPDWQGPLPEAADLNITSRAGVDLNPFTAADPAHRLRLLSYIWPDQSARLARMRAALDLATAQPPDLTKGDAAAWIADQLATPHTGQATVIYHTIAWQYFPTGTQAAARAAIETAGAKATRSAPLIWLSMEADADPDGAALSLRLWPGDETISLGRADFHGRWIRWNA
jgi:hypothetical protein